MRSGDLWRPDAAGIAPDRWPAACCPSRSPASILWRSVTSRRPDVAGVAPDRWPPVSYPVEISGVALWRSVTSRYLGNLKILFVGIRAARLLPRQDLRRPPVLYRRFWLCGPVWRFKFRPPACCPSRSPASILWASVTSRRRDPRPPVSYPVEISGVALLRSVTSRRGRCRSGSLASGQLSRRDHRARSCGDP